jgi:lipopolysaccharide/colanic/teichoic acid biosynthesis glycosyltransferase
MSILLSLISLRLKRRISNLTVKVRFIDNFIILSKGKLGQEIEAAVKEEQGFGFNFIGYVQAKGKSNPGNIEDEIITLCEKSGVRTIVCENDIKLSTHIRKEARRRNIRISRAEDFYEQITGKFPIFDSEGYWYTGHPDFNEKTLFDFVSRLYSSIFGFFCLLITLPFYPFIIIAIKLNSKGSAFFIQERVGKNGKPFNFIKFRTMVENPDRQNQEINWMNTAVPEAEHPDITSVGKFLRKYKIDEIPQFISLIKGDMNLIGPRAERPKAFKEREKIVPFYAERLRIKPGITGWAQANPFKSASAKLQFDLFYIKHRSLLLDMLIVLKTLWIMLRGNNDL